MRLEIRIRKVQEEIREKKNKVYMKETFRESCESLTENEYRRHLEKYKGKSGIKDETRYINIINVINA